LPDSAPEARALLRIGAAQILVLGTPAHAAVGETVEAANALTGGRPFAKLINAVLRKVAQDGPALLAELDVVPLDTPKWLFTRWQQNFGDETARAIAIAHGHEPPLDLTVKSDAASWAQRLRGRVLPTGTVRTIASGPISQQPGYEAGEWWVQDAAAALPARLLCSFFGDVRGKAVADLCAAPGGKTAQLVQAGARVTAVDRSGVRLARLRQNLTRLKLEAEVVEVDAAQWQGGPFDAVLVDAPCSSTGTVRRHPDIPWLKSEADLGKLAALQTRLLDQAAALVKPGGTLVYCTCSLEREEGEDQIAALLARNPALRLDPIRAEETGGQAEFLNADGALRTLPCHWPDAEPRMAGLDGFYAARILKIEGT
jgi:16S rRNA (cytosine967-C5)-methyltransferase